MIKNAFISRAALSFNPGFFSFGIFAPRSRGEHRRLRRVNCPKRRCSPGSSAGWRSGRSEALRVQPGETVLGELAPSAIDGQRVPAAGELLELGDGRRLPVRL